MRRSTLLGVGALWFLFPLVGSAQQPAFATSTLAEMRIAQLPSGELVFRLETFGSRAAAEATAGPTGLVAELAGQVYLVTLGPAGGSSPGGTRVAEVGLAPPPSASEYLFRLVELTAPPGAEGAVHTHPGAESYYVVAGEFGVRTPSGVLNGRAGQGVVGPVGGTPVQSFNAGPSDVRTLAMFLVDAAQPITSPAEFPAAAAAQPKPGAPAPKPGEPASKPGIPATKPAPAASPAPAAKPAAPVQAPRALPRTGEADPTSWAIGGLAVVGTVLLGVGLVTRRRGI